MFCRDLTPDEANLGIIFNTPNQFMFIGNLQASLCVADAKLAIIFPLSKNSGVHCVHFRCERNGHGLTYDFCMNLIIFAEKTVSNDQ